MGLHFTAEEFFKRKRDVLRSMKEKNLDALLMFRQESMYWLTGYDTFGYVFFQTLILDQKGNTILLTRAPDLRQAQNTSNIKDIRIWIDKDFYVFTGSTVGVVPILGKGLYAGKIDKLGSVKAIIH